MNSWTRGVSTVELKGMTKQKGYGQSDRGYAATVRGEVESELRRRNKIKKKDIANLTVEQARSLYKQNGVEPRF